MQPDHIVYVVDDDERVREALEQLLASAHRHAITFRLAADYMAYPKPELPSCLVLDIQLPDVNGLEFHREVAESHEMPVIFITGHGDVPSSVRAIKAGAVDFLMKPFSDDELLNAITAAIAQDRARRQRRAALQLLRDRYGRLTPRERDVLPLVVGGLLNKQAAAVLGISEITLQIHRSRIMRKMEARSIPQLVRQAERLGLEPFHSLLEDSGDMAASGDKVSHGAGQVRRDGI